MCFLWSFHCSDELCMSYRTKLSVHYAITAFNAATSFQDHRGPTTKTRLRIRNAWLLTYLSNDRKPLAATCLSHGPIIIETVQIPWWKGHNHDTNISLFL